MTKEAQVDSASVRWDRSFRVPIRPITRPCDMSAGSMRMFPATAFRPGTTAPGAGLGSLLDLNAERPITNLLVGRDRQVEVAVAPPRPPRLNSRLVLKAINLAT